MDAESTGMVNEIGNLRTPNLVLARHTIGVRAGPPNPSSLQHHGGLAGSRQMPGEILPAFAAANNYISETILPHWDLSLKGYPAS